ncbi:MAG: DUF1820 family protein [Candidatus Binatia bacterium]|nr:DUF1820 family protein [Candidatus Binatia bacterium]
MAQKKLLFRVVFHSQGRIYEVYAKQVSQSSLFGFIEVEGLVFGAKSNVVVDPSEEALQREFEGAERTYIPIHSVLRIDAVEKRGQAKVYTMAEGGAKVTPLPTPIYTPVKRDS